MKYYRLIRANREWSGVTCARLYCRLRSHVTDEKFIAKFIWSDSLELRRQYRDNWRLLCDVRDWEEVEWSGVFRDERSGMEVSVERYDERRDTVEFIGYRGEWEEMPATNFLTVFDPVVVDEGYTQGYLDGSSGLKWL